MSSLLARPIVRVRTTKRSVTLDNIYTVLNLHDCDFQDTHFLQKLWAPRPTITTGGYDRESGLKAAEETRQLVGYGRAFLSNASISAYGMNCHG